jgi:hypothetical protein
MRYFSFAFATCGGWMDRAVSTMAFSWCDHRQQFDSNLERDGALTILLGLSSYELVVSAGG